MNLIGANRAINKKKIIPRIFTPKNTTTALKTLLHEMVNG